jgi:phage-related protein
VSGRDSLDTSISELRRILYPINKILQLPISDSQRKFINTTVSNIVISDVGGGYAAINIELSTSDPYNYDLVTTQALNVSNLNTSGTAYAMTFGGTAKQLPIITVVLDTFTDGDDNKTITLRNQTTDQYIGVLKKWATSDVLVVDCQNSTVTVNGISIEFSGRLLYFDTGTGYLQYEDEFATRQVDINVIYTKRYA